MIITDRMLGELRVKVGVGLSQKRYRHILEVEKMADRIAGIYCPDDRMMLRAAALLHDITKEYDYSLQESILVSHGEPVSDTDRLAPKTYHARTAALLIPELYPDFASEEIISAVRWHTTGKAGMTLYEKIIYLADYIDMSRKFDDCVMLRNLFWDAKPEDMTEHERLVHLDRTLTVSFDMTVKSLLQDGLPVSDHTNFARNDLLIKLQKTQ